MSKPFNTTSHRPLEQLLRITGLVLLLGFALPMTTFAAPEVPEGAEKCIGCHPEQTENWRNSPHAEAILNDTLRGVTCESCHGEYVLGHPDDGVQLLPIDSSVCEDCHGNTFEQWEHSTHAQAGVQCIGCHLAHPLDFRLTEEALCHSCHLDHYEYYSSTPHSDVGLTCPDCHFPSTPISELVFNSEDCTSCHEGSVHQTIGTLHQANTVPVANTQVQPVSQSDYAPAISLCAESPVLEQEEAPPTMTLVSLGLGIGIGGMLGIIFMQFVGYMNLMRVRR